MYFGIRTTIATYTLAQEGIDFLDGGMKAWNLQIQSGM